MRTDDLTALLSDDLKPASRALVPGLLLLGLAAGLILCAALMMVTLGPRPDLAIALSGQIFWMKFVYVLAVGALGLWMVERQARAGAPARTPFLLLALPLVAMIVVASVQLSAPRADSAALIMGRSASVCPFLILMLALPVYAALLLALRRLAPTQLGLAGAAAGLAAGGFAAAVYCFHCPETAAPFVVIWYSLGMLLAAALGALVGRFAMRW